MVKPKETIMKQLDIFGNEVTVKKEFPVGKRYRTMQQMYGIKEGKKCGDCKHCINCGYHGRSYYKCELWIISHSSATDIRLKNTACNKYESEETKDGK